MEKEFKFEECMTRLEEIVDTISKDTMSLDESLKLYEEGKKLIKIMEDKLQEAETKVEKVVDIEE